jgi:hypothetical protein
MKVLMLIVAAVLVTRCTHEESVSSTSTADEATVQLLDVAQTSGQLASGSSFRISGSSSDRTDDTSGQNHHGHNGHHPRSSVPLLDGVSLLAPTDELLAIVDAESAGDIRGFRISTRGGATITHYTASGDTVVLPAPKHQGPAGCSLSGGQFPEYDSLLETIVKTEIDFGDGVTFTRDTVTITRSGKIVITRSKDGGVTTEVISFEDYQVNGATIEGTKTRVTSYDESTGSGSSVTAVEGGIITFADGTVATWTSDKIRTTNFTISEETGKPIGGTIITEVNTKVVGEGGDIIYSHETATPLLENIACEKRRHGPVSGVLETIYHDDTLVVNYGDGSCENKTVTITLNGETITKSIGE